MEDTQPFELPQASDKLTYKFLLDAMTEENPTVSEMAAPAEEPPQSAMAPETTIINLDPAPTPQEIATEEPLDLKKYYRIGEAAQLVGVEAYVLRYWENEFPMVRPTKAGSGHRVYSAKDLETLRQIRHLLHEEKFSIKGAKKKLLCLRREQRKISDGVLQKHRAQLRSIAQELRALIQVIHGNPGTQS